MCSPACLQYLVWLSCEEITATKCLQKLLIGPWHRLGGIFAHSSVKKSFYSGMSVDFLTWTAAFLHHFWWIKVRTVTQPYKALLLSNYSWYNNLCAPCVVILMRDPLSAEIRFTGRSPDPLPSEFPGRIQNSLLWWKAVLAQSQAMMGIMVQSSVSLPPEASLFKPLSFILVWYKHFEQPSDSSLWSLSNAYAIVSLPQIFKENNYLQI